MVGMTFWEWAGAFSLAAVSCGAAVMLLRWLKEHLDRKARKISYHAKCLLEQADQVCGIARAMLAVAKDEVGSDRLRPQASVLWASSSTSSLLNVWLANAWVLDKRRSLHPFRARFEAAVERLRLAAMQWHEADLKWRNARGITENERIIGGGPDQSPEADEKANAARAVAEAFKVFLKEFQALHNALQASVREYVSQPEVTAGDGKQ
jgi:hypothetical protein